MSSLTDVPLTEIIPSISNHNETSIYKTKQRMVNHGHVIDEIFKILASRRHTSRMTSRLRGLFLLLGRSGAAKAEIAKAVAEYWYSDVSKLVEIDVSEYAEPQLESTSLAGSKRMRGRFLETSHRGYKKMSLLSDSSGQN